MRLLRCILVLIFPMLLTAQEQITDIYSPRHNESFISISDGELEGEPITAYLDYRRLFIDYENEELEDYYIAYDYTCFRQRKLLGENYFYINFGSTLVFDLRAKKIHDHFSFSDDWRDLSIQELDGRLISRMQSYDNEKFSFGIYNPETKEKSISQAHDLVFSHNGELYYSDSTSNEQVIGKIDIQDLSEDVVYQGEELFYLGDGFFRDVDGHIYVNVLDGDATKSCIPAGYPVGDLLATKMYVREKFNVIETYNDSLSEYSYFGGDSCVYMELITSSIPVQFDFFNDTNFGFKVSGDYIRMRHQNIGIPFRFSYTSNEDHNNSNRWVMSEDTAYFLRTKFVSGQNVRQVFRYTPASTLFFDDKNLVETLSYNLNIIEVKANNSGNLILTINSEEEGIYSLVLNSKGEEIDSVHLYKPIYHDHDAKNINWSPFLNGHLRTTQIKPTNKFRVDRIEYGQLLSSDTMLMRPYLDKDIIVSMIERDGDKVLQFTERSLLSTVEVINPEIDPNFSSRIIRIGNEIWLYTRINTASPDIILRYGLDGSFIGEGNMDLSNVVYHDDNGLLFIGDLGDYPRYLFHYDGNELVQLSDQLVSSTYNFRKGGKHYIFTFFQGEIRLYDYDGTQKSITLLGSFNGHFDISGSLHSSQQEDRVFSIFDNVDNSDKIINIIFSGDSYRVEDFDLAESTFVGTAKTLPINGGYIYSIHAETTNVYVDSNGVSRDIPLDSPDEFLIEDMLQTDQSVYLFGFSNRTSLLFKCDSEFNDCETIRDFKPAFCDEHFKITLLGRNNNEVYFSSAGQGPLQTIWTLDLLNDEVYHYNNDEETQIKFFERRDFFHKGHVYFTGARADQIDQLFKIKVSESPTATKETTAENAFVVYPNPASGQTTISSEIDLDQFSIYNFSGKEVVNDKFDNNRNYALPNLNSGYYIIQAQGKDGKQYISKLVVID